MASHRPTVAALLCALVLAPRTFARNRFFDWYRNPAMAQVRRRASLLRGILRQLVGTEPQHGQVVGEQVLEDGRVLLRYVIPSVSYARTTALSPLEASLLRYALARARRLAPPPEDQVRVDQALAGLGPDWVFRNDEVPCTDPPT